MIVMVSDLGRTEDAFCSMGAGWEVLFKHMSQNVRMMRTTWEESWYVLMCDFRAASRGARAAAHRQWILCCRYLVEQRVCSMTEQLYSIYPNEHTWVSWPDSIPSNYRGRTTWWL